MPRCTSPPDSARSDCRHLPGAATVRELLSRNRNMNFLNFINHPLVGTPYGFALDLCIVLAIVCWVLSILTREYSWTDRLWSIVPAVYCLIVAVDLEFQSARVNIMTVLATLWGIRLTFNYALKGGYWIGGEDYRWIYLRLRFCHLCISSVLALDGSGQRCVDIAFSSLYTTRRGDIERKILRLQQVPGHGTKVHSMDEAGLYPRKITSSLRFFKGFKELLAIPDGL